MLARRIEDLPIALIVATAARRRAAARRALRTRPARSCSTRSRSAADAVARVLVAGAVDGEPEPAFVAAAAETTGGNPLLVRELRAHARRRGLHRQRGRGGAGPPRRAGLDRPARPGPAVAAADRTAVALARARRRARRARAARARRTRSPGSTTASPPTRTRSLAASACWSRGALRFTHPMMREATLAGLVPATRSLLAPPRRRAALRGGRERGRGRRAAARRRAGHDPRAARLLRTAGARALAAGDTDVAVRPSAARAA